MRRVVGLLLQRELLDLELADAPRDLVELGRHGVDLNAQLRRRLVDEVDGLVGQEAPGDVAVRQHRRRHQRGVLNAHLVVRHVALGQPAQNGDGVLDRGLAHEHGLEAALQRGVLLNGGAVLVERGGADQAQLAPGQHGLDHLPGVHGALGRTGADDRVQLVDEGDDLALGVGDLLEHRLQALFELAPVLGAGHHGAQVERDDALALQALGHVALDDAVGQPLDDGRLAHAGLADEDRVVLGAARQHLDHPADLLVAADDRVELALAGRLGEVAPVLGQGLVGLLGVGRRDAVVAPHRAQRRQQRVLGDADLVGQGQHEVLHRHVVVAEVAAVLVRRLQHRPGVTGQPGLGAALGAGQARQLVVHLAGQHVGVDADLGQQRARHRLLLLQQGVEQVGRRQLGMVRRGGVARRRAEGGLGVVRPAFGVYRHRLAFLMSRLVRARRAVSSSRRLSRPLSSSVTLSARTSGPPPERHRRLAQRHQVAPVLAVGGGHGVERLRPHLASSSRSRASSASSCSTRRTPSRLSPVDGQLLDVAQALEVVLGEAPAPAAGARRVEQALALVDAQRLRVHPGQLGRHRDHVDGLVPSRSAITSSPHCHFHVRLLVHAARTHPSTAIAAPARSPRPATRPPPAARR